MASSGGHLLVPMAMRIVRHAVKKASSFIRSNLPAESRTLDPQLQPVLVRNLTRHPAHRAALLRQSKGRWYSSHSAINTTLRRFTTSIRPSGLKYDRASFPRSSIGNAVARTSGRAPFASTLRPNLTGGALSRTAGGYSTGAGRIGGVRHFSHSPAGSAEVVTNVSAAVRAFCLSGHKARYAGNSRFTGDKRFESVSCLQDETARKTRASPYSAPGSYIDFQLSPTITAVSPLVGISSSGSLETRTASSVNTDGLLDVLSADFARALQELSIVLSDLKRLSTLGDLQISAPSPSTLRVRFPGCDAESVERLCLEIGLQRGRIRQDDDFDALVGTEVALMFPFAPSTATSSAPSLAERQLRDQVEWQTMMTPSPRPRPVSRPFSTYSNTSTDDDDDVVMCLPAGSNSNNRGAIPPSPSGYSSLHASELDPWAAELHSGMIRISECAAVDGPGATTTTAEDYEGLEGIYRFLEMCDGARR